MEQCIRKEMELRERATLSPWAAFSDTALRETPEEPCRIRTAYQHDRDRIIHSKAFRRLKHKTQVFFAPSGDHYRTRLTHTLEVSQIARTIARALLLNEDLTEAIALGHDLGHTPFGHSGERVLSKVVAGGFHHTRQSLRVVEVLEHDGAGLNLTSEVRDGILKHSKGRGRVVSRASEGGPLSLEGQVVRLSDLIAYVNHDLDDAIRANVISEDEIPRGIVDVLGSGSSERINRMVIDTINGSEVGAQGVIRMEDRMYSALLELRDYLYRYVYENSAVAEDLNRAEKVLEALYHYMIADEQRFYEKYGTRARPDDTLERSVTDYLAGMTDRYALNVYMEVFLPRPWTTL
ncbi:MAG: deoxyguanosinetriphosphate triphosphohydrolase [Myxococcota bacterium]|jgi:dGTPase